MELRTELPTMFNDFAEARQQGFLAVKKLKDEGKPIVGVYCTFMPEELTMAAGALQISLCSTSDETIPDAEEVLPRNLCPLIKSSFGFGKTDKCPYFYFSDLIVGESTCDGKKKMYEYMTDFKDLYLMHLPNMRNSPEASGLWKAEMIRFKEKLEDYFGVVVTDEAIKEAIILKNQERQARKDFYGLGKLNPLPIKGSEIFKVMYGANYSFDKPKLIQDLNDMTESILKDYEDSPKEKSSKPRILITGSPIGGVTEKVIRAIEENGGEIVAFENCTVAKPIERLVDEENPDIYEALAEKYLDIGCACVSNNQPRIDMLDRMVDEYQVDGVLDMVLQFCTPFSVESLKIKEFCQKEKGVPYLYLETDYSNADVEQINTRVEAFIEMIGG